MKKLTKEELKDFETKRNELLRNLDVDGLIALGNEFNLTKAQNMIEKDAILIAMHKMRVRLNDFTEEEKELSKKWLKDRNYSLEISYMENEKAK